jgi:hypothetical protein
VGPVNHTSQIAVNIAALTAAEVDSKGWLKPGVPLEKDGTLILAAAGIVHGVTIEPLKVANGNAAGDLTAAGVQQIAVATICQVNRAIVEKNLGRVLTANEIAGFGLAGSLVKLL